MADNLIYPIEFDLQKAVEKAGQDWDKTYAKKLETYLAKRPIKVKLNFENLTDVKTRLAQLKIEPITPETKASIKELARELQVLAKALEQVQKYSKNPAQLGQQNFRNDVQLEKLRQANERLDIQKRRVALAEQKHAEAMNRSASVSKQLSSEFQNQEGYVSRLIKRMAVYASFSYMGQFLTNVREVTAQFELQRISLGAIIQDQNRANQLFSEIKSFALQSPVSILDLTKYTKQLAAYKFETEELFDWTKRLTDISVGLSVPMERIVLLAGQVRATGWLRQSEVRQATEAGIPLVEELATKLTKMNGELVTASEVMDMISKRAISWEMVADIFKDMTSAGGTFYNMQEKQGNTLFGLWAKLGDAASVMYEEIGNTESVNKGMKNAIMLLTEFMRNWKALANTAAFVVAPSALFGMFTKYALSSTRKQAADAAATAATKAREAAVLQLNRAIKKGSVDDINAAYATLQKAKADEAAAQKAATKAGLLASGFKSIASSMAMGLGIGLVVTAVTSLAYKLFEAWENARRLKNKLNEIDAERVVVTAQSVRNFEYLADSAIKAADGSKEQKDKLDELHRTFQDMIPVEDMSIENLRRLRSGADSAAEGYKSLTESIRNYIAQQQKQKSLGAIEEEFGAKRITAMKNLYDWFDKQGLGVEERTRFFAEFEKQAQDTSKTLKEQIVAAFNEAGIEGGEKLVNSIVKEKSFWAKAVDWLGVNRPMEFGATAALLNWAEYGSVLPDKSYVNDLANATRKYNEEVSGTLSYYEKLEGNIGKYTKALDEAKQHMSDFIPMGLKENTFAYQQQVNAEQIRTWGGVIVDALKAENVKIENEWFNIDKDKAFDVADIASINIKAIKDALGTGHGDIKKLLDKIAESYNEIIPKDAVVRSVRSKFEELANSMGLIDKVNGSLMGATEGLEDYRKKINDTAKDYAKQVENLTKVLAATPTVLVEYKEIVDKLKNAKDLEVFFSKMAEILGKSSSGSSTRTSDPRLQNLKEEISLTKKLYDEYHKLEKQIGATKAAEKIQKIYSNTIKTLQGRAKKYGFEFELPFTDENLKSNMQHFIDKMKELQKLRDKKGKPLFPNIGKEIDEAVAQLEDVDLNSLQKALEKKLKELADRISRTKTAKEFYEKILSQTGDVELAANVSLQIYGSTGRDLKEQVKEQFAKAFEGLKSDHADIMPDVTDIINRGAYEELRDYIALLPEPQRKAAEDLVKAQEQMSVKQYEQWLKDLEKAKDYADKRIELSRYTANQIAAIEERIAKLNPQAADYEQQKAILEKLIAGYKSRESKMGSELEYEQFKNSALYVQVFENLDNASKTALENMRNRLLALKDQWKNLSPEKVKELTKRLEELDAQIAQRNPFKSIADSIKKLREMRMGGRTKEGDAQIAFDAEADRQAAEAKMLADEKAYEAAVKQYGAESDIAKAKRKIADDSAEAYRRAEQTADSAAENADEWGKVAEAINAANQKLDIYQQQINEALDGIRKIMESFGASAEDMQFFDDITNGFNEIFDAGQQGAEAYASFMMGDFVGAATKGISAVGSLIGGVTNLFNAGRVKRANKEIKRQQELLERLEYTYSRLEAAADKVFGADYISNYNAQMRNLQAQAAAYRKQAEAERSKGKDADEDKIQQYENSYRDTMDKIADMQSHLAEQMTGTDVASAARDFAQAWLEAYATFGNTTDAIKEKFNDMIKYMIVESVMAKTVQMALQPMFDEMNRMYQSGKSMTDVLTYAFSNVGALTQQINDGLMVNAKHLEAVGVNIRDLYSTSDNLSGISKNIASATSEEINAAAAIGNTLMYYVSPIPRIDENLARVVAIMEGRGASAIPQTTSTGWTDWQQQAMDNYNAIARNTADTVVECRRAAEACERIASTFKAKGSIKGLNVFLNS